jgi:hypothetical protein
MADCTVLFADASGFLARTTSTRGVLCAVGASSAVRSRFRSAVSAFVDEARGSSVGHRMRVGGKLVTLTAREAQVLELLATPAPSSTTMRCIRV